MKTMLLISVLVIFNAAAFPGPKVAKPPEEQTVQQQVHCLPLRTLGIAESAASYADYVKSRCQKMRRT